jgi:hypothetical protein
MGKNGGRRPGAGRKPGKTIQAKYDLAEMAKAYAPEALAILAKIMRSGDGEAARVSAADKLLDRGYGKPSQSLEHTGKDGADIKHDIVVRIVRPHDR